LPHGISTGRSIGAAAVWRKRLDSSQSEGCLFAQSRQLCFFVTALREHRANDALLDEIPKTR
jgi:hypothetical protein